MLAKISQNNQPFVFEGQIVVDCSVCVADTVSETLTEGTTLCSWNTDSSTLHWTATVRMIATERSMLFRGRATGPQK